ncbi:MAG: ribonuclease P protein component [Chlamydiota bacterium]
MLPKRLRIKKRIEYRRLLKNSSRKQGKFFFLNVQMTNQPYAKLGITAPKKFGHAPDRNRFKRIAREAFRAIYSDLPPGSLIHVSPRQKAKEAKMTDIAQEMTTLIHETQS